MAGHTRLQERMVGIQLLLLGKSSSINLMTLVLASTNKKYRSPALSPSSHASSVPSPTTYSYTQEIAPSTMVPGVLPTFTKESRTFGTTLSSGSADDPAGIGQTKRAWLEIRAKRCRRPPLSLTKKAASHQAPGFETTTPEDLMDMREKAPMNQMKIREASQIPNSRIPGKAGITGRHGKRQRRRADKTSREAATEKMMARKTKRRDGRPVTQRCRRKRLVRTLMEREAKRLATIIPTLILQIILSTRKRSTIMAMRIET